MMIELTDLVNRARKGDQKALSELVILYRMPALRVAQNILGDRDDAEDALQTAWILAIQSLDSLREPSRFAAWLYRVVANVSLRHRQQRRAIADASRLLELVSSGNSSPQSSNDDLLPLAMNALSHRDHLVTILFYFSGVPQQSIASLLGIPIGTVKSRLHHGRQVLRKEILKMAKKDIKQTDYVPQDFRKTITGMGGKIPWENISSGDFSGWTTDKPIAPDSSPDHWQKVGNNGLLGEMRRNGTRLLYGEREWRNMELSMLITPLTGGNAQVVFRVDENANGFYLFDMLMGWQAVAISKVSQDANGLAHVVKLSVVNYPLQHERDYAINIAARDQSITTYIDGAPVNQVTDDSCVTSAHMAPPSPVC
ncbi:MAG: sigma-70 family RNA polymerase sigma factor [Pseudomonadales bacterium]|jgi:RNA polymerase sigma-70 factor (ECF subfamily)|nr:sigma-70 family RNA polymerase sigma factor [Pseudomonadales bacterium]